MTTEDDLKDDFLTKVDVSKCHDSAIHPEVVTSGEIKTTQSYFDDLIQQSSFTDIDNTQADHVTVTEGRPTNLSETNVAAGENVFEVSSKREAGCGIAMTKSKEDCDPILENGDSFVREKTVNSECDIGVFNDDENQSENVSSNDEDLCESAETFENDENWDPLENVPDDYIFCESEEDQTTDEDESFCDENNNSVGSPDIESDDSYDIFEREDSLRRFVAQMSDKPCTNYEGAIERNQARYRHQVATGEFVPEDISDEEHEKTVPKLPLITGEEKQRREIYALQGSQHLLHLSKLLASYFMKGKEHNIPMGQRVLAYLFNYSYSPLMVVYSYPLVEIIIRLTYYGQDSLIRRYARQCYERFKPMFLIPDGKTFLMVLQEEVKDKKLPFKMTQFPLRRTKNQNDHCNA